MAAPAAPVLKLEGSKVMVSFDVPAGASVAVVYFFSARGKAFYDAESKSILERGRTGKVISLATKGAGRKSVKSKSVEVTNLTGGMAYTATVSFRGADDFDFGPTSPASDSLTLVPPIAPQAPRIEAHGSTSIRVTYVLPPDCVGADVIFHDGRKELTVAPDLTLRHPEYGGATCGKPGPSIVVTGLSDQLKYKVSLNAYDGFCWGPRGPWSKPLKIVENVPDPPTAPIVDKVTQNSFRLRLNLMPDCTHGGVYLSHGSVQEQFCDKTLQLVAQGAIGPSAFKLKHGVVISGLQPDTLYHVYISAASAIGWSKTGPASTFRTLSDVEITGARTQEARDAELRKNAIDVDALDPAPAAKRPKKEK